MTVSSVKNLSLKLFKEPTVSLVVLKFYDFFPKFEMTKTNSLRAEGKLFKKRRKPPEQNFS
jgi:hypothetical protein